MALIGTIRKNSWILIVAIALGMGGFIVMDMVQANQGPGGGGSALSMGKVNGNKVSAADFDRVYNLRYGNSSGNQYANRNALWQWYIEDGLLKEEAEALGLGISAAEITDLEFGDRPSAVIQRNFASQDQPGTVNRQMLDFYKQMIEENTIEEQIAQGVVSPTFPEFWQMQRQMIVKERLQEKLTSLFRQAVYTPTWMADMGYKEQSGYTDFSYVQVPYDRIPNDQVSIADADLEAYLKENKGMYERKEEQRVIDYVVFDVLPSKADSTALSNGLAALVDGFQNAENDSTFVLTRKGVINPSYAGKEDLGTVIGDTVMSLPVGTVFGPYVESGEYRLVKVIDRVSMVDSADTRHILISAQTPDQFTKAEARIDSMMAVIQSGAARFDSLAVKFSQDPGSAAKGGKYENVTPNQFVPEYNEVLFVTGEIGKLYKVRTSYGVHLVEVLARKGSSQPRAKVAFLREAIIPSKETRDNVYERVTKFVSDHGDLASMTAAAKKQSDLRVMSTRPLIQSDYMLGELGFSNDTKRALCWAFNASPGDMSNDVYAFADQARFYDNKYVVIGLSKVLPKGMPSVEDVREEIEAAVTNRKKAEAIRGQIQGKDLATVGQQFAATVENATNTTYSQSALGSYGNEPKVLATAAATAEGQPVKLVDGVAGVYAIQVTRKPALATATNLPQIKMNLTRSAKTQANQLMNFMRDGADVDDNRSTFDCNF